MNKGIVRAVALLSMALAVGKGVHGIKEQTIEIARVGAALVELPSIAMADSTNSVVIQAAAALTLAKTATKFFDEGLRKRETRTFVDLCNVAKCVLYGRVAAFDVMRIIDAEEVALHNKMYADPAAMRQFKMMQYLYLLGEIVVRGLAIYAAPAGALRGEAAPAGEENALTLYKALSQFGDAIELLRGFVRAQTAGLKRCDEQAMSEVNEADFEFEQMLRAQAETRAAQLPAEPQQLATP